MFKGSIPAVITPFNKEKDIDFDLLKKHVNFLINEGSSGLVSCGTTGESPTLSHEEHKKVTETIINTSAGRVPVMAGCGSNSTKESIELVKHANGTNASGVLLVSPYYNKPSQEGLYNHFISIAHSTPEIQVYLYNIPGRSVINIDQETMKRLSKIKNIVGVKDATSDLSLPLETKMNCGSNFNQLSGEDATFLSFLISGGIGCISVTANVIPKLCSDLYKCWTSRKIDEAMKINDLIYPLNKVLFTETSPAPVKYALSLMGKCDNQLRLPMVNVDSKTEDLIYHVLNSLKLVD